MRRVNLVLKDKLFDEINREAKKQGISRSSLINAALKRYIDAKRSGQAHEEERNKMHQAARRMDA